MTLIHTVDSDFVHNIFRVSILHNFKLFPKGIFVNNVRISAEQN